MQVALTPDETRILVELLSVGEGDHEPHGLPIAVRFYPDRVEVRRGTQWRLWDATADSNTDDSIFNFEGDESVLRGDLVLMKVFACDEGAFRPPR